MKKNIFVLIAIFSLSIVNAQFTVTETDGAAITDNQVFEFNTNTYPNASLGFFVNNTSTTDPIRIFIEVESITNADGSGMELCFGTCYNSVQEGMSYPTTAPMIIQPGQNQGTAGDHFFNSDSSMDAIEYVFKFYQVNNFNQEIGTPLRITYRYDQNLSIEDQDLNTVEIFPTQVKNELTVSSYKDLTAEFYDILGKKVKQVNILAGESQVDVSDLSSQLYIIRFISEEGNISTQKIVVE